MPQVSPKIAISYAESTIQTYWRKIRVYAVFYYGASTFSLIMGVAPGIIYAVLQLYKSNTSDQAYALVAISTVICSSIASFVASVLNFFVVREKFGEYKQIYYEINAEYTLFKSGTGAYYKNDESHLVLLTRLTQKMRIKGPHEYGPNRKV